MIDALADGSYTVEEIDAITGPALGRPKSATFRTMDIAGLDVLALVVRNLYDRLPEGARDAFAVPPLLARLIEKGWVGEKAGQGFYKRVKNAAGESEIHALDPATFEYRAGAAREARRAGSRQVHRRRRRARADAVWRSRPGRDFPPAHAGADAGLHGQGRARDRALDRRRRPRAAVGLWLGTGALRAHRRDRRGRGRRRLAPIGRRRRTRSLACWPRPSRRAATASATGTVPPAGPDLQILRTAKERERVVKRNAGASLVDLGDGVLAVEFHSKMNAIGGDTIQMINAGVAEAERNFQALVVGNDAPNFSAGANVMLLLLEAQEGNWDEIDLMVRGLPGRDQRVALREGAGRRGASGPGAGRGLRSGAARRPRAGGRRDLHRAGRSRRRPDSGRWRHQGDAGACGRVPGAAGRSAAPQASACSRRLGSRRSPPAPPTRGASGTSAMSTASR